MRAKSENNEKGSALTVEPSSVASANPAEAVRTAHDTEVRPQGGEYAERRRAASALGEARDEVRAEAKTAGNESFEDKVTDFLDRVKKSAAMFADVFLKGVRLRK